MKIRRFREGGGTYQDTRIDRNAADLIVGIDGKKITTFDELMTIMERTRSLPIGSSSALFAMAANSIFPSPSVEESEENIDEFCMMNDAL